MVTCVVQTKATTCAIKAACPAACGHHVYRKLSTRQTTTRCQGSPYQMLLQCQGTASKPILSDPFVAIEASQQKRKLTDNYGIWTHPQVTLPSMEDQQPRGRSYVQMPPQFLLAGCNHRNWSPPDEQTFGHTQIRCTPAADSASSGSGKEKDKLCTLPVLD